MTIDAKKPQPPPVYKVKRTFHQRILPSSTCTPFSSPAGRSLFDSASRHHGLKSFFRLIEQFLTQSEPAYCGITTLVMVLNSLSVDPRIIWKGGWRWYEDSMLNCCVDMESVKESGISLPKFVCLANCQGLQSERFLASESSVDNFRAAVKEACIERVAADTVQTSLSSSPDEAGTEHKCAPQCSDKPQCCDNEESQKILVATYHRGTLGQTGSGHFSPIAAYDPTSDKVLILDVARFKYGPHWVSLPLLFEAMMPCDPATDQSRGFILLSFQETPDCCQRVLPQSILFRSEMSNYEARQRYRDFLSARDKSVAVAGGSHTDGSITLKEVHNFASQNGRNCDSVLEMISPQLIPLNLPDKKNVDNLLYLIQSLTQSHIEKYRSKGCKMEHECTFGEVPTGMSARRMIQVRPVDIIYVIFLSSLSIIDRKKLVQRSMDENQIEDISDEVVDQLLSEAELVRLAIEYSYANVDGPDEMKGEGAKKSCYPS